MDFEVWSTVRDAPLRRPSCQYIFIVTRLPKTRSGKIMRRLLKAVAAGSALGDVTTVEDESAVDEVRTAYQEVMRDLGGAT